MSGQTILQFLGVETSCTMDELKAAWRKKAKELHPDVNGGDARKTALFVEAKSLYEEAVAWKEKNLAAPKPPDPPAQDSFEEILRRQSQQSQQQRGGFGQYGGGLGGFSWFR